MNALFLADSFVKSFGSKPVLKSATAWATSGRITVVFGRNGCGKTTLLRAALGLTGADHGLVRFDGVVVQRPRLWRLAAQGVFYLPDRELLSRRMRFDQQLGLVEKRFHVDPAGPLLEQLDVAGQLGSYPHQMSGGLLRRAELALAFARHPRCLLADEPLAGVEPKYRQVVASLLRSQADAGAAVLVTGHDALELLELADEVIWMVAGTTHGLGSSDEARNHHPFRREYLGIQP